MRARDIPLNVHGWTPPCTCFHDLEDHKRYGDGACTQLDSYDLPCQCPSYERDPNEDDDEDEET